MTSPQVRGFTLLELMLVLVVMAVVASFVLPNLFQPANAAPDHAARRMLRVLHLAADEAQLRGSVLRFNARPDRYDFELADTDGHWQVLSDAPFAEQVLAEGVTISEVKLAEGVQFYGGLTDQAWQPQEQVPAGSEGGKSTETAPIGSIMLMPDGMLTLADLTLHAASGDVHIELRPGPGGIRMLDSKP